jgi:hypothetical protein
LYRFLERELKLLQGLSMVGCRFAYEVAFIVRHLESVVKAFQSTVLHGFEYALSGGERVQLFPVLSAASPSVSDNPTGIYMNFVFSVARYDAHLVKGSFFPSGPLLDSMLVAQ